MTRLEVLALSVTGVWLTIVSVVVILLVRQLGLIAVRLREMGNFSLSNDGPLIGSPIPEQVTMSISGVGEAVHHVLLISPTCGPCRELADQLRGRTYATGMTALVPGAGEVADALIALLPEGFSIVRDPIATEVANALGIRSTPFAVRLEDSIVKAKSYLNSADDLLRLVEWDGKEDPSILEHINKYDVSNLEGRVEHVPG